jgi:hypothetical protein
MEIEEDEEIQERIKKNQKYRNELIETLKQK